MERASAAICPPLDDKCYGMSFDAAKAFAESTPKGWCLIGWVVRDSGREAWDAWYNIGTTSSPKRGACVACRTRSGRVAGDMPQERDPSPLRGDQATTAS
jgi:hypothetical protein